MKCKSLMAAMNTMTAGYCYNYNNKNDDGNNNILYYLCTFTLAFSNANIYKFNEDKNKKKYNHHYLVVSSSSLSQAIIIRQHIVVIHKNQR